MSRLHILSPPLWVKFLAAFLAAMIIPMMVLIAVGLQAVGQINRQNLEAYVTESGSRQYTIIADNLNYASDKSFEFANQADSSFSALLNLLLESTSPDAREIYAENIERNIRNVLLANEPFFGGAWLLDTEGNVLIQAVSEDQTLASDQSTALTFLTAQALAGSEQEITTGAMVIEERAGRQHIEIVNLIYNVDFARERSAGPIAYFIVDLNIDTLILDHIQNTNDTLPVYTFLVHSSGETISRPETAAADLISTNTVGVQRARNLSDGTATYLTGAKGDREVSGYYRPLQLGNTSFVFITEINAEAGIGQTASFFRAASFPVLIGLAALLVILILLMNQLLVPALSQLREAMRGMMRGAYDVPVGANQRGDEIGALSSTFVAMRDQIQKLTQKMSQRVEARTHDLTTTHEISRIASSQRDLQTLMETVVNLIVERFDGIYHAQIFLIDDEHRMALLRASTGEAGKKLLERGHRLAVGSISVIGQVTQQGQIIISRDTGAGEVHKRNEFLPDTRAELAIPLALGNQIIGALDIQSKEREIFDEDMVRVLQAMADQVSIAIENTRLYEESTRRLKDLEQTHQQQTRRAWQNYMYGIRADNLASRAGSITPTQFDELRATAQKTAKPAIGEATERNTVPPAIPIRLRGEVLGVVEWELPQSEFNQNQVLLAEELANRLAISLENARLVQESRKTADRERLVNTVGTQLSQQSDINEILHTAIREVGQALQAPQVHIQLRGSQSESIENGKPTDPAENASNNKTSNKSRSKTNGTG